MTRGSIGSIFDRIPEAAGDTIVSRYFSRGIHIVSTTS